jgi:hypothetical protein
MNLSPEIAALLGFIVGCVVTAFAIHDAKKNKDDLF